MAKVKEKFMQEGKIKDIKAEFSFLSLAVGAIGGIIGYHFIFRPVFGLPALNSMNKMRQENTTLRKTTNDLLNKISKMQSKPAPTAKPEIPTVNPNNTQIKKTVNTYGMIDGVKLYRPNMPTPTRTLNPGNPDLPDAGATELQRKYGAMNKIMNSDERAKMFGFMNPQITSNAAARVGML